MNYWHSTVLLALLYYLPNVSLQGSFRLVQPAAHTLPSGLLAVNGSDDRGDCGDRSSQSNGLRVCEDPNGIGFSSNPTKSVLVDDTTPTLDFSDENWAEGFFTVSRNDRTTIELGFELDTNDNITRVEVESLECLDRGIGARNISLFGMEDPVGASFPTFGGTAMPLDTVAPEATSCSVLTHTLSITMGEQPYRYYYLVFTYSNSDIDWLFLAEVTFLINNSSSTPTTTTVTPPPPSSRTTSQPHIPSRTSQPQVTPTSQYLVPTPSSSNPAIVESGGQAHSDPNLMIILAGGIGVSLLLMATVVVLSIIICYIAVIKKRRKIGAKDDDHCYEDIVNFRGGKDIEVVNPVYAMIAEKGERPNTAAGIQLEKNRAYGHSDSKSHIYCNSDCK